MPKKITKILVCALVVILTTALGVNITHAQGNGSEDPCKAALESARNGSWIQSSFPVKDCLKTEGQNVDLIPSEGAPSQPGQPTGIAGALVKIIDFLVKIIASIALIVFIIGALLTIVSEGKEDRVEKGKNAMVYSLIGLAICMFAFIIVAFVQSILF